MRSIVGQELHRVLPTRVKIPDESRYHTTHGLARQTSSRNKSSPETDRWVTKIIFATESAIRRGSFEQNTADELRTCINASILSAKVPKSNLTKEEVCALNALRKDNSVTILPADKGRCTVIFDKKDYDFKVKPLLDDKKIYSV